MLRQRTSTPRGDRDNIWPGAVWSSSIGRRRFVAAASGAVATLALACTSSSNSKRATTVGTASTPATGKQTSTAPGRAGATPATQRVETGGTVQIALVGEPPTWDPQVNPVSPNEIWDGYISDFFMEMDPTTLELQPAMVEKWEFSDPTTLTMHAREGVKFHATAPANGRVMVADDLAYTLKRGSTNDPSFLYHARFDVIDRIDVPDPKTVTVHLKRPSASLMTYIAIQPVLNRESIEAAGGVIKDPRKAIGVGPFMARDYTAGVGGTLVRNPNYWKSGQPYLDGMEWTVIADRAATLAAFRSSKLDLFGANTKSEQSEAERTYPGIIHTVSAGTYPEGFLTDNAKPPFNDLRVRQAIDLVIDRQQLIQSIAGGLAVLVSPVSDILLPGYGIPADELVLRPGYRPQKDEDITKAKQLLAAAGYQNGLDLPADGTEYISFINLDPLTASVAQFAKAGIHVHVDKVLDRATFLDTALKGTALFRAFGVIAAAESQDQLFQHYHSTAPRNYEHYASQDKAIEQQDTILDVPQRKAFTVQLNRQILDDVAYPLAYSVISYTFVRPGMHITDKAQQYQAEGRPGEWWKEKRIR